MTTYGPVERAARAELRALHLSVRDNTAAAALVAVAKRLDASPGAASAAAAGREVRLSIAALRGVPPNPDHELADLFASLG